MTRVENGTILEYDEKEYKIETIPSNLLWFKGARNIFRVKRVSDDTVLQTYIGEISNIIEFEENGYNHFIVIDEISGDKEGSCELRHDIDINGCLEIAGMYKCNSCSQIKDGLFCLNMGEDNIRLYNLVEISKPFSAIYTDKEVCELMGKNAILVSEEKKSKYDKNVVDTITYGINPNSYRMVTPIWSDLQQRYIDLTCFHSSFIDEFVEKEIQAPLDEIAKNMKKGPSVFTTTGEVNKEFVKGFTN